MLERSSWERGEDRNRGEDAELLCRGCRSAGIDAGHGPSEHDHEGGQEDA